MKIEYETVELKILIAKNGYWLTNGETFGKEIYLGINDSEKNWWEISEEEYLNELENNTKKVSD